ncbi:hypothetical protein KBD49_09120 [Myxococcota bacterium]|nr:hypothetical protein [Myxococcota bacterium]
MNRGRTIARNPATLTCLLAALAACGGDGGNVKSPFGAPTRTTVFAVDGRMPTGEVKPWTVKVTGEVEVDGRAFDTYQVGIDPADPRQGIEIWIDKEDEHRVTFRGFREVGVLTVQGDRPYTVRLDGPAGQVETVEVAGTVATENDPNPRPGTATVEYVKESDDVTIDTPFGTLSGVKHFRGTVTLQGEGVPEILRGFPVEAQVWYHPSFGVVKGDVPMFHLGMDLRGEADCGDPLTPGFNTIQKVGLVAPGGEPFELSTSDCSGQWNADKMTHAKMLLELRFAEEALARTSTRPPVVEEFTTGWGYFPHQLVASPFSIFHPEENGKGYTFWYGYADEAARNEPGDNGILYSIEVRPADSMSNAVRATARIRYNVLATP